MGSDEPIEQGDVNEQVVEDSTVESSDENQESLVGDIVDEVVEPELEESVDLTAELLAANERADENWEKVLLAKADVENMRRRTEKDVEKARRFAVERFAKDMLAVVDSLEMGLSAVAEAGSDVDALKEGMDLTYKQLLSALEKAGVEQVDPMGLPFDPEFHQAMSMVPSPDHEPNTVIQVFQKGYTLNKRLIRPAMVIVSQA